MPNGRYKQRVGRVTIFKRNNWWAGRYSVAGQEVVRSLKVTAQAEAIKKAQRITILLDKEDYEALDDLDQRQHITFGQLLDEFSRSFVGWSPSTWAGTRSIRRILNDAWGPLPLSAVTRRKAQGYLALRVDRGEITHATHNRYVSCLRRVFYQAVEWGYLEESPMQELRLLKEDQIIPEALSDTQLDAYLPQLKPELRDLVVVAIDTGMRRGELFRLAWTDLDFEGGYIRVGTSKTKQFRVVPMTERARAVLARRKRRRKDQRITDLRVFPYADPKKGLASAAQRAGLGHVHMHMFRHTFATRLRDKGVPLDRIMELLGQKSMQMVLRYAKARPQHLEEAIEALNT